MQKYPDAACFLPEHAGDWIYAPLEIMCSVLALVTLYTLSQTGRSTEDVRLDTVPVWPFFLVAGAFSWWTGTTCNYWICDFQLNI